MGRFNEFRQGLRELVEDMTENGTSEAFRSANRLADAIRAAAPKRTGNLAASVRVETGAIGAYVVRAGGGLGNGGKLDLHASAGEKAGLTVMMTPNGTGLNGQSVYYDYAIATEFGTHKEPAHPFFYSTWRRMGPSEQDRLMVALAKPLNKDRS